MKKRVFVVACSGRSGSTLMQRLLMTHPDLFMWGEGDHLFRHLMQTRELFEKKELHTSTSSWRAMHENGILRSWYPLLLPIRPEGSFHMQIAKWIDDLMVNPYDPDKSWGCKFVHLTPKYVKQLHELFPDAGFIFLERAWHQVWASMQCAPSWFPEDNPGERYMLWNNMMMFQRAWLPRTASDVCATGGQPAVETARIERHLGMEAGSLNQAVFNYKSKGW